MRVDVEYAHIYLEPDASLDAAELQLSATLAEQVRTWHEASGDSVTLSSLVDEYTSPGGDIQAALDVLATLTPAPSAVYREGDFAPAADALIGSLRSKFIRERVTGRTFLAEGRDLAAAVSETRGVTLYDIVSGHRDLAPSRFRFALNFDVDYRDAAGAVKLACPVLAAAWQLHRLGLGSTDVSPVTGDPRPPADLVVSVLPADYIQVEASVRALLQAIGDRGRNAAARIRYVFF